MNEIMGMERMSGSIPTVNDVPHCFILQYTCGLAIKRLCPRSFPRASVDNFVFPLGVNAEKVA